MTDRLLLTHKELVQLTGYTRASKQADWLRANGFRFTVNALGDTIVAVSEFNRRMTGTDNEVYAVPNLAALDNIMPCSFQNTSNSIKGHTTT